jgi:hypothetical protein
MSIFAMKLAQDMVVQLQKDFGPNFEVARRFLQNQPDLLEEPLRVLRCVIFLAEGEMDLLCKLMAAARADYRDVIFWAEYTDHEKASPPQIYDFSRPLGSHQRKTKAKSKQKHRLPTDVRAYFQRQGRAHAK